MNPGSEMKPYRVEWRPDLITMWLLIRSQNTHDEARACAADSLKRWGGQVRIVTQHVVEVIGIGTNKEAA
jgi:hypothetical protein